MYRLQHLQWLAAGVAAVGCIILGGAAILTNMADYDRFSHGATELGRFVTVLEVANAVSAERGPANSAMAAEPNQIDGTRRLLARKRAETNAALSRMEAALISSAARDPQELASLTGLRLTLQTGRDKVDAVIDTPAALRETKQLPHAILAMFRAADSAALVRNRIGGRIVAETPELAGEIMLASSASELREQAGRLGSYVVMILTAPPDEDGEYRPLLDQTNAIIQNLWSNGLGNLGQFTDSAGMQFLIKTVENEFINRAAPRAMATATILGPQNGMTAGAFTAIYVPGMASLEHLRTELVRNSLDQLGSRRDQALQAIINSATLTGLILAVLVVIAVIFRRILFVPLLALRDQALALANGDLSDPAFSRLNATEVNDIFDGLSVLRDHQREKKALEDRQRRLNRQLKRLSETDMLTGLLNRRALLDRAKVLFRRADATGEDLAVLLFDVDHFKVVNDTHGHAVGDEVLVGVAREIEKLLRPGDAFARIGGEEFAIILRRVDFIEALQLAEAMRTHLSSCQVQATQAISVTASFGLTLRPARSGLDWDAVFRLADQHLYAAKHSGRNRVVTGPKPPTKLRLV